jgi:hypothetical protein
MAFDTDQATVYQVRPRHRHQEVQEVIPRNYLGVMVTDRGRSYEAHSFNQVKQQKCLAHLQKTLSTLLEKKKGRAREFGPRFYRGQDAVPDGPGLVGGIPRWRDDGLCDQSLP